MCMGICHTCTCTCTCSYTCVILYLALQQVHTQEDNDLVTSDNLSYGTLEELQPSIIYDEISNGREPDEEEPMPEYVEIID